MEKNAKKNKEIKNYLKPSLSQTQFSKQVRENKVADEELRNKIREQYLYECPKSTAEKTAAEVFKRIAEYKLKAKQRDLASLNTGEETFQPQLSKGHTRRYETFRSHDGAWQLNELMQKEAWSCCMNENFKSKGCVVKLRDIDRWITLSL